MTHSDNVAEAIRKWCELPAESSDELPVRMSTILEFARSAYSGIVGEDGSSELCNAHQRIIEKALPRILSSEMGWSWLVTGGESSVQSTCAGLSAESEDLRLLSIKSLFVASCNNENSAPIRCCWMLSYQDLCKSIVRAVADSSLHVSNVATDTLASALKWVVSRLEQDATEVNKAISMLTQCVKEARTGEDSFSSLKSSVLSVRWAHLIASCAGTSNHAFLAMKQSGLLTDVIEPALNVLDPLVCLNVMELLPHLVSSSSGCCYLYDCGAMALLLELSLGKDGSEPDTLLGCPALSVLTDIITKASAADVEAWSTLDPGIIQRFLKAIFYHIASSQHDSNQMAGFWAISSFARSSVTSMQAVMDNSELLKAWLHLNGRTVIIKGTLLRSIARTLGEPPRDSALEAIPNGGGNDENSFDNEEQRSIQCKRLWDALGEINGRLPTMQLLMENIRLPVSEVRNATYYLLRCAAHQRGGWGLKYMTANGGELISWLKANTETSKEGMELKYGVVEGMMACSNLSQLVDNQTKMQLEKMLKAGPYVPQTIAQEVDTKSR